MEMGNRRPYRRFCFVFYVLYCWIQVCFHLHVVGGVRHGQTSTTEDNNNNHHDAWPSALFTVAPQVQVIGPTGFAKPNRLVSKDAVIAVKPTFGEHRPDQDAVFAYAEGYGVPYYIMFLQTLRSTGFDGDVVLAIAHYSLLQDGVEDYLRSQKNVVVYIHELLCYETDEVTIGPRKKTNQGQLDVFQMCRLPNVYGIRDEAGVIHPAPDPRIGRVVATIRYEWYWIWATHYNPNSWIMLLDARDSFFQTNPFANLPRSSNTTTDGLLYFFGENTEATRLGKSTKNILWLRNAYGVTTFSALSNKPTICSGSTMGEQVALETYLRALVNKWDETDIKMTGADQGFHNYLYYSNKLANVKTIRQMFVWEQGKGVINNLGALRIKPLEEWGMYDTATYSVYNWGEKSGQRGELSPVVHQWDRDHHLHNWIVRHKHGQWQREWRKQQKQVE